jgi:hypothetical protein
VKVADGVCACAGLQELSVAALAGFSGAWALFGWVLPAAGPAARASDMARAARALRVMPGGPAGRQRVEFGPAGSADASTNLRAGSVVWEWTRVNRREVVWPPRLATARLWILPIAV